MLRNVESDKIVAEIERVIKKHAKKLAQQIMKNNELVISYNKKTHEYKSELKSILEGKDNYRHRMDQIK